MLDKYELLEEVGQGGMAVVYRGIDRTLHREVAVKVLHKHLAGQKEARDRFEREAHAVAKLRHENILEIFDFSGATSEESYIVTEFIRGETLRDFMAAHRIAFPEIGALIAVQICRALHHAHGFGVLHRDIKPENIMIRDDGVVKLMDFGIAQMVDLQRMTVTGQLLGSPAYMSPEHVGGRPLDFRTDVFSVGILLYQMVTGELPFTGRNPHEILKRIAECKFVRAQEINPLVGSELGEVIERAMAREPEDRFSDICEVQNRLEQYLYEGGLQDYRGELARFFAAPANYEVALRARLLDAFMRRGRALLAGGQAADRIRALELYNRVLTLDPGNPEVLAQVNRISRRRRGARFFLAAAGAAALVLVLFAAKSLLDRGKPAPPAVASVAISQPPPLAAANPVTQPGGDAAASPSRPPGESEGAAATGTAGSAAEDAAVAEASRRGQAAAEPADAAAGQVHATAAARSVTLVVFPPDSEFRVGEGSWETIDGTSAQVSLPAGSQTVEVRNRACCNSVKETIAADVADSTLPLTLGWLPGEIIARCDHPETRVQIDGKAVPVDRPIEIPIGSSPTGYRSLEVVFFAGEEKFDKQSVRLRYSQSRIVSCRF